MLEGWCYCAKMVRPCLRTTRIRLVFYEEIVSTFYIGLLRATVVFVPTCCLFLSLSPFYDSNAIALIISRIFKYGDFVSA